MTNARGLCVSMIILAKVERVRYEIVGIRAMLRHLTDGQAEE